MLVLRHYADPPAAAGAAVAALGNFDGVHLGHQAVIRAAANEALALAAPRLVLTFEPHPRRLFQPHAAPFRLTSLRTKARYLEALGVDVLVVLRFDRAFSEVTAEEFVETVLVHGLGVRHVAVGYNFVFGNRRRGDTALLVRMGKAMGFGVSEVAPVAGADGVPYSSTLVREALAAGDPTTAAALLGRLWEVEGRVVVGDRRGQRLGFPTANLTLADFLRPRTGVYAVRAGVDQGARTVWRDGVANFGRRPTFAGDDLVLEVHLFDFADDLYGKHLRVRFVDYLRPERRFEGIDALRLQIAEDGESARRALAAMCGEKRAS
ncbi:MAG: bifunctional riboflavin kinase/FAD synthetase [Kiloniellales bacterium]